MEAKPSPAMIVTAIEAKNTSQRSGAMPRMVVPEASTTGRRRLTEAATIASDCGSPASAFWASISSTRTMAFLMSIPDRLRRPRSAVKLKGSPVKRRPSAAPFTAIGTIVQITAVCRRRPKSRIVIRSMVPKASGICRPRLSCAWPALSCSPPHSMR
jgi:hypothetical protein